MRSLNKTRGQRKKKRRFLYSWASIALLICIAFFLGYQTYELQKKRNVSLDKKMQASAELARYSKEEETLRSRIEELETPEGRERVIRERFNVVKDGEGVIYVIEEEQGIGANIILEKETADEENVWQLLKSFFGLR